MYADEFGEDDEDDEDEDDLDEPAAMQNMVLSHLVLQIQEDCRPCCATRTCNPWSLARRTVALQPCLP